MSYISFYIYIVDIHKNNLSYTSNLLFPIQTHFLFSVYRKMFSKFCFLWISFGVYEMYFFVNLYRWWEFFSNCVVDCLCRHFPTTSIRSHSAPYFLEENLKLIWGWRSFSPEYAALDRIFIDIKPKNTHGKYSIHMGNYLVDSARDFTPRGTY